MIFWMCSMRLINYLEALAATVGVTHMAKAGFFDSEPAGYIWGGVIGGITGAIVSAAEPVVQHLGQDAPACARHSFSIAAALTASFTVTNIVFALKTEDAVSRAKYFANALTCFSLFTAGYLINPETLSTTIINRWNSIKANLCGQSFLAKTSPSATTPKTTTVNTDSPAHKK